MRLSFPNGEHPDVPLKEGELSVGSAPGNGLPLPVPGVSARHANFELNPQRGILLSVLDAAAGVHVNGRPVRELAFLRVGDVVSIGRVQTLLKPDRDASIDTKVPADSRPLGDGAQRTAAQRVVLRGIAGAYFGRTVSLCDPVTVGRGTAANIRLDEPDLPELAAQIELYGDRVLLRDLGSPDGAVVNGVPVKSAVLHPGDQIAFETHRFVLEAPGLPSRGVEPMAPPAPRSGAGTTQTMSAVRAEPPTPRPGPEIEVPIGPSSDPRGSSAMGWLLAAAVLLAGALAAWFFYPPR